MRNARSIVAVVLTLFAMPVFSLLFNAIAAAADSGVAETLILNNQWQEVIKIKPKDAVSTYLVALGYGLLEQTDEMHQQREHMEKYDGFRGAVRNFANAFAEKHPRDAIAHYIVGDALLMNDDRNGAIRAYEKATELDPTLADAYTQLALIYSRSGSDWQKVLHYATNAVQASPKSARAYLPLGTANVRLGKLDDATKAFADAFAILQDKGVKRGYVLGQVLCYQGYIYMNRPSPDNEKALEVLTKAIEADHAHPDAAISYNQLGVVYKRKNMFDKAIECYQAGIKLNPAASEMSCLYFNLGVSYYRKGMTKEARAAFEEAIKRESDGQYGRLARQWLSQI